MLWDGVVVPAASDARRWPALGQAVEFVKDQYRHCKTMLVLGAESALVDAGDAAGALPDGSDDPGLVMARSGDAARAPSSPPSRAIATTSARPIRRGSDAVPPPMRLAVVPAARSSAPVSA